jgi:hypothetical protein
LIAEIQAERILSFTFDGDESLLKPRSHESLIRSLEHTTASRRIQKADYHRKFRGTIQSSAGRSVIEKLISSIRYE